VNTIKSQISLRVSIELMQGWIAIHRSIMDHWIAQSDVDFSRWCKLMLQVNHKPKKHRLGNNLIEVKRGQSSNSLRTWADLFKCSTKGVSSWFKVLEEDDMIKVETLGSGKHKTTLVTVVNYDQYQDVSETQEKHNGNAKDTLQIHDGNSMESERKLEPDTNNNGNNGNNENKENNETKEQGGMGESHDSQHPHFIIFQRFQKKIKDDYRTILNMPSQITFREFSKLVSQFGEELIFNELSEFSKNHSVLARDSVYRTLLNWLKKASIPENQIDFKNIFIYYYSKYSNGEQYIWSSKDDNSLKYLMDKIEKSWSNKASNADKEFDHEQAKKTLKTLLDRLPPFYQDKLDVTFLNSEFNKIAIEVQKSKQKGHENTSISRKAKKTGERKSFVPNG
tara:strand:+ start:3862 stop:5043 length:1182 start_codon:yes stop_codon:yes gene_type:complete